MSHQHRPHHAHTPEVHEAPDAWHTHTVEEHPMQPHAEKLDGWKVFIIGLINYIFCLATIAAVWVYFVAYKDNLKITSEEFPEQFDGQKAIHTPALDQRAAVLGPAFANTTPLWTDAQAGAVTIPMEKAMAKTIERYRPAK